MTTKPMSKFRAPISKRRGRPSLMRTFMLQVYGSDGTCTVAELMEQMSKTSAEIFKLVSDAKDASLLSGESGNFKVNETALRKLS